jgi:hypothetical protein
MGVYLKENLRVWNTEPRISYLLLFQSSILYSLKHAYIVQVRVKDSRTN